VTISPHALLCPQWGFIFESHFIGGLARKYTRKKLSRQSFRKYGYVEGNNLQLV